MSIIRRPLADNPKAYMTNVQLPPTRHPPQAESGRWSQPKPADSQAGALPPQPAQPLPAPPPPPQGSLGNNIDTYA